jgi:energy-coupling factor transporter ATP-binding protein EcfA2
MSKKKIGEVKDGNHLNQLEYLKKLYQQGQINTSQVLIELGNRAHEYFVTTDKEVYATLKVNGSSETVNVFSSMYIRWLRHQFFLLLKKPVAKNNIMEAVETIAAREIMESNNVKDVYLRIAGNKSGLYIDLANENRQIVEVKKGYWSLTDSSTINFKRPSTFKPLPTPDLNGDLNLLRKYITLDNHSWILVLSFIIGCYLPNGPYPILILQGSQGSGKSTLSKIIKSIVDPSKSMITSLPNNEKDLLITAQNNHLLVFDNLSGLTNQMSDAICKLSTGGGFTTKKLYTDTEEVVLSAKKPVILNGIDYIATRNDLADRAIILSLPKMSSKARKDEYSLWSEFYRDLPFILGGIFHILGQILKNYSTTKLDKPSRMADFVRWISAGEQMLGLNKNEFMSIYENNKNEAAYEALEQDILALSINELLRKRKFIEGTSTHIIHHLRQMLSDLGIPIKEQWIAVNKLRDSILRIEPILNRNGIYYEYKRGKNRIHKLYREEQ